ncbi:MAG: hypothetical protein OXC26_12680 [Albidovulum sp.]|nr:hypothetical protein [Albidovulum sp.]
MPAEEWPSAVSDARAFAADAKELLRSGAVDRDAAALLEAGG